MSGNAFAILDYFMLENNYMEDFNYLALQSYYYECT
jgi:hypothetical protein